MKFIIVLLLLISVAFSERLFAQDIKQRDSIGFDAEVAKFNGGLPLFIDGNVIGKDSGKNIIFSSAIFPFSPGIPGSFGFELHHAASGRSMGLISNLPIRKIFQCLYGEGRIGTPTLTEFMAHPVPISKTELRNVDSTTLVDYVNGVRRWENLYNIHIVSKNELSEKEMIKLMISDIEKCFGLKTFWEKQVKKCIVVSRSEYPLAEYKAGPRLFLYGSLIDINDIPIKQFLNRMARSKEFHNSKYPIVDETSFMGNLGKISLQPVNKILDYEYLSKELLKYGLRLSVEDREVDILVITSADK